MIFYLFLYFVISCHCALCSVSTVQSHVWAFLSQRRLCSFHHVYLQRFFLLGLLYQYMAWLATLLLSILFVAVRKVRRLAGITYCIFIPVRCEDRRRSRPGRPAYRPPCCSCIRRSTFRPKPQQQLPFSYCRPQKTVRDGQDPLALSLPRAQDGRTEETQNRSPPIFFFHHVSCRRYSPYSYRW
jgi:hypothetical protein